MSKLLELPECFAMKIVVDSMMKQEASKDVVDMHEYKKLRKQKVVLRNKCADYKQNRY